MELTYFTRAVIEAVLAGALAGLVGVLVVVRQRAFFTMSLTHATFPGAIAATLLGIPPVVGAAVGSIGLVGIATAIGRIRAQGASVASGIMLTTGFALGILLQSVSSVPINVESFLTGSILATDVQQLTLTVVVLVFAAAMIVVFGRRILFESFDRDAYRAAGMRSWFIESLTLTLIAATVVTLMPVVGAILSVALIVAPAAAAQQFTRTVTGMFVLAPVLGTFSGVAGLLLSRALEISAGGAITLVATACFAVSLVPFRRMLGRRRATDVGSR